MKFWHNLAITRREPRPGERAHADVRGRPAAYYRTLTRTWCCSWWWSPRCPCSSRAPSSLPVQAGLPDQGGGEPGGLLTSTAAPSRLPGGPPGRHPGPGRTYTVPELAQRPSSGQTDPCARSTSGFTWTGLVDAEARPGGLRRAFNHTGGQLRPAPVVQAAIKRSTTSQTSFAGLRAAPLTTWREETHQGREWLLKATMTSRPSSPGGERAPGPDRLRLYLNARASSNQAPPGGGAGLGAWRDILHTPRDQGRVTIIERPNAPGPGDDLRRRPPKNGQWIICAHRRWPTPSCTWCRGPAAAIPIFVIAASHRGVSLFPGPPPGAAHRRSRRTEGT